MKISEIATSWKIRLIQFRRMYSAPTRQALSTTADFIFTALTTIRNTRQSAMTERTAMLT